jgi:hypothetical protein
MRRLAVLVAMGFALALAVPAAALAGPEYEQAYVNATTVTINAIEVHQSQGALTHAAADFYQVVYPTDRSLWPAATVQSLRPPGERDRSHRLPRPRARFRARDDRR